MVDEWTNTTLGAICSFASGSVFPQSEQGDAFGTYPFIKVSDMNLPGNERFITVANNWIDEKTQTRLRAKVHPAGATVFAKIGVALTYNRRRVLSQPTIIDNNMMTAIGDNARVHPLFFYYLLRTIDLNDVVAGTALPYLNISDLKRIAVTLPSLKEQRAIAHILGTLDDKIELNRRMNRTLEEMARAIFKSWFVDFDPVRAKMEGRWKKGESLPGLPADLWDVFPDKLVDSELGKIPERWAISTIGDMVQVLGGGTPSTKNPAYWEGGTHPFCTPKDMASLTDPVLLQTERHITDEGLAKVSSGQLPVGTVLLSSRAPIGYLAVAETPVSVNQGVIAMVCDAELPNLFALHWTEANMDRVLANANGSTFMEISKRNFRPITVVLPKQDILYRFNQIVEPLHKRVVSLLIEIQHLVAIRDALLPKLISGELRVPDAEQIA